MQSLFLHNLKNLMSTKVLKNCMAPKSPTNCASRQAIFAFKDVMQGVIASLTYDQSPSLLILATAHVRPNFC